MDPKPWPAGTRMHGFTVTEVTPLAEINLTLVELQHDRTGARMVHLAAEDSNNLFAVGFRTPPENSTGVAHILEHTALCGSRRYPVRDPFFSMLKRSLNTFMNALTANDWTLYPFSSQNHKDFFNLLGIYLDAAFFPLLRERDFRQEGHRLEFSDPNDPQSALTYRGIVYNEMKGAMSDPASLLSRRIGQALYPTTTYRYNSGGEPEDIPKLNWDELRAFHARYYHPSNAYLFSYGNFDLAEILAAIDDQALRHFDASPVTSEVPPETHLQQPWRQEETFPLDPGTPTEGRTLVQTAWLTCDINEQLDRLGLSLLAGLLLGNPGAPLYKALLDSGLGTNLAPGNGYHDDYRTTFFATGLQGTEPEHTEAIERLILDTLSQVAATGFSKERIEGVIHRLEFSVKEVTGDQYPYSLGLLMRIMGNWIHGGRPADALRFDALLTRLREEVAAGPFFQQLIRRYLLDNPHRVTLTLKPDLGMKAKQEQTLADNLEQLRSSLSAEQVEQLRNQAKELQDAQEQIDDLSCLPTLELADIPEQELPVTNRLSILADRPVRWFDQPTNGIGYLTMPLATEHLPAQLRPLVPIFTTLLTQIGAAGHGYAEMAERMEASTGGIQARSLILDEPDRLDRLQALIYVKGKALNRNQAAMFDILGDLFQAPDFSDLQRLHRVLNQTKTFIENAIPGSGHSFAARNAASGLTPSCGSSPNRCSS
ncbi:MAG: insulinase family protein [Desulfuromonadaceae bacterium]